MRLCGKIRLCNIRPDLARNVLAQMRKILNTKSSAIWERDAKTCQNATPHRRDEKIADDKRKQGNAELHRRENNLLFLKEAVVLIQTCQEYNNADERNATREEIFYKIASFHIIFLLMFTRCLVLNARLVQV
jgi:hypothetical protein